MSKDYLHCPWWLTVIIILLLLPLFTWPGVIAEVLEDNDKYSSWSVIMFLFPLYAVLSCYYAYKSYETRRELSFILLGVLLLAYACCYFILQGTNL